MMTTNALLQGCICLLLVYLSEYQYLLPTGPYGVGHRQTVLSGKNTPPVSVYYPIDREEYENNIDDYTKTSSFCLNGDKDIQGFKVGLPTIRKISSNSEIIKAIVFGFVEFLNLELNELLHYQLQAINGVKIHKDFKKNGKKLTPVIISHGLLGNSTFLFSFASHLASYGCIVYCPTHTDTSSNYFKDKSSKPQKDVFFENYDDKKHNVIEPLFRKRLLECRIQDIKQTIEFVKVDSIKKSINLNKLVAFGHSMGGLTSVEMTKRFQTDFKIC